MKTGRQLLTDYNNTSNSILVNSLDKDKWLSQVFTILEYMSFFFGQSSSLFTRKLKAYWCKDCGPKSSIVWDPAAALGPFLSDLFRVSWSSLLCFWGLSLLFGLFLQFEINFSTISFDFSNDCQWKGKMYACRRLDF